MIIFTNKYFHEVKIVKFAYLLVALFVASCGTGNKSAGESGVAQCADDAWELAAPDGMQVAVTHIDTMNLENPYITYDVKSNGYYMVADGGYMWTSRDMHTWMGPYEVLQQDTASWIGASPVVTSPEIHKFNNRYYYMATFEVPGCVVNDASGKPFVRRSCSALVADSIVGPYRTIDPNSELLVKEEMAAHPTFCIDEFKVGYMIYNHQGEQNGDGTVQIVRFTPDLGRRMGEAYVMFTASKNNWSQAVVDGKIQFSPVMESPTFFIANDYVLGIMFNTYIKGERAVGVAYSNTGSLNGPWVIDDKPLFTDGLGVVNMFNDYDGTLVVVANKDTIVNGEKRNTIKLFKADTQFDKLQIKGYYKF